MKISTVSLLCSLYASCYVSVSAFILRPMYSSGMRNTYWAHQHVDMYLTSKPKGFVEELLSPFRSPDIPNEYKEQIIKAEAGTAAAKDRDKRILLYAMFCLLTFSLGAMNAFFGISANSSAGDSSLPSDIKQIQNNPILNFFLLNKLGGALSLVFTGIGGTMIELEQRTKAENAEKIWTELQRRRAKEDSSNTASSSSSSSSSSKPKTSSKKMKQNKKLSALAEVLLVTTDVEKDPNPSISTRSPTDPVTKSSTGMLEKIKDFYNQADQLAASQALLLNKELEDRGILEKITDESGLKVVTKKKSQDEPL